MYEATTAFLDRDGVINRDEGYTHVFHPELIYFDIKSLSDLKLKEIFIITNQSGIGRGYYTEKQFHEFMEKLIHYLHERFDLKIKDYFFCPHLPKAQQRTPLCSCRKPEPGMFYQAQKLHGIDFSKSFMIGDKISDVKASYKAGIRKNFLLRRSKNDYKTAAHTQTALNSYAASEIETLHELRTKLRSNI